MSDGWQESAGSGGVKSRAQRRFIAKSPRSRTRRFLARPM